MSSRRRVCWAPRDLLISFHFNCLKNKLCRLQFLQVLVAMWTCGDFCLAFSPPLPCRELLQSLKVIKDSWKNKFPNVPAPCIHTYSFCMSQHHTLSQPENKRKRHRLMSSSSFFPYFVSSSTVLSNIATFQLISLFPCACSILVHKPRDWISH